MVLTARILKKIVIDEFAGYFVTIIGGGVDLLSLTVAFVAFRIFDIGKPPPVKQVERLPKGSGVVVDDVVAGIYANLAVLVFWTLF